MKSPDPYIKQYDNQSVLVLIQVNVSRWLSVVSTNTLHRLKEICYSVSLINASCALVPAIGKKVSQ